jgi:riboflavin kinase/FMN adenylyltransferase
VDSLPVSSSRIRKLLAASQIDQVNRLLGYTYTISGIVEQGNAIGATIGFPTANIRLNSAKQLPAIGVYSVVAQVNGVEYKALANIGTNPTVGNDHLSLEVHLLDFQGDLYGQQLSISFLSFLREEKKFASLSELKSQIAADVRFVHKKC